jgi:hypothetical protein
MKKSELSQLIRETIQEVLAEFNSHQFEFIPLKTNKESLLIFKSKFPLSTTTLVKAEKDLKSWQFQSVNSYVEVITFKFNTPLKGYDIDQVFTLRSEQLSLAKNLQTEGYQGISHIQINPLNAKSLIDVYVGTTIFRKEFFEKVQVITRKS